MRVSLVVPLFNEEQTVGAFYRAVRQDSSLQACTVEIVLCILKKRSTTGRHAQLGTASGADWPVSGN